MAFGYLVLSVVLLLFQPDNSSQDCRIVQTTAKLQSYWCNTIQELETNGNAQLLDVNIYNGNVLPVISNATHRKSPHLQVILTDDAGQGLSAATYTILKDLAKLFSKNSQVTTINKGLFENLPLQKLTLNDNGIQSIQVGAFSNMQNLKELRITHNNLRSVETGIFNSLAVDTLSLSNNKISTIRRNALFNMRNLRHLHLDGNYLTEFRPELFISYGANLETLLLQNNYLTDFDRNTIKTLDNLKILNLGSNNIQKIVIYSFENLLNLEELILSNNQIQDLDADVFAVDGMPALVKLQLNDNRFSFLTPKVLGRLSNLKYIRVGGNPWMCPCFDAIIRWLSDHGIQQFCDFEYYTGTRPVCVVPDVRTTACDYSTTSDQYVKKFSEANIHSNKVCLQ